MDERATVLLVDDHRVVIEGIRRALEKENEFQVVGEALDGHEAVHKAMSLRPDIIVLDISMPRLDGISATRSIKKVSPESRIVIYTMYSDKDYVVTLFKEGVSAFVLKEDPLTELILALKAVKGGGTYFSTKAPTILVRHMETLTEGNREKEICEILSQREMEVFLLLAKGKSTKAIAKMLFISPKTVETHRYHIMQKLEADSVVALSRMAIRKGLIQA